MRRALLMAALPALLCAGGTEAGQLATFATLPPNSTPQGGLVIGANGDFYGVAALGGPNGGSAIFDLTRSGYLFPPVAIPASFGANAIGPLVADGAGNLYGVSAGSLSNNGAIFELSKSGALTRFAVFNGTNGSRPMAPLLFFGGQFYGTTSGGGTNASGVVFSVRAGGAIQGIASLGGSLGSNPDSGVVAAPNGSFLGTTPTGGQNNDGTIFSVTASNGVAQTLVTFSPTNGGPPGALTAAPGGVAYGVTTGGAGSGSGTIFQITSRGRFPSVRTLHTFTGPDGAAPNGPLLLARDGQLYGTTQAQGANGLGTFFSISPSGNFTLLASFTGANGAYPRGGLLEGPDGNFYGVSRGVGGAPTVFQFGAIAPEIVQGPTNRAWAANGRAAFTVVAAGTEPLRYQWLLNDVALPGETNATLVLAGEATNDIGAYTVVVSNPFGSTNASASLITSAPIITARALPSVVTTTGLSWEGTANAKLGVSAVKITLNDAPVPAALDLPNWSATLELTPGSNSIEVFATDNFGAASRVIRASVFFKTPGQFTWATNGFGRIFASVATNPAPLIGRWATFTAVPGPQNIFTGWTISSNGVETNETANPLQVLMPDALSLQASFTTNFFRPLAGVYTGLFFEPAHITPQSAGRVNVTVGPNGGFSGRLLLGGGSASFSGAFNGLGAGEANATVAGAGVGKQQLILQLTLTNGASELTGSVSGAGNLAFVAPLMAERASSARGAERFTMLFPPLSDAAPSGDGLALISMRNSGATFSGRLADGMVFSESAPVSVSGLFPLYSSLYNGGGLLVGWLDFSGGAPQGTVTWIKQPSAVQTFYRMGFTNVAAVLSSLWTNPPTDEPAFAPSPGALTISGGGLTQPLNYTIGLNAKNQLVAESGATNSLAIAVNRTNGLVRVTFGNGHGRATTTGYGVILQNANSAGGYFLGATNAGAISLQ